MNDIPEAEVALLRRAIKNIKKMNQKEKKPQWGEERESLSFPIPFGFRQHSKIKN